MNEIYILFICILNLNLSHLREISTLSLQICSLVLHTQKSVYLSLLRIVREKEEKRHCERYKKIHFNTPKNLLITLYKSFHAPRFIFICKSKKKKKRERIKILYKKRKRDGKEVLCVPYQSISSQKSPLYAFNVSWILIFLLLLLTRLYSSSLKLAWRDKECERERIYTHLKCWC